MNEIPREITETTDLGSASDIGEIKAENTDQHLDQHSKKSKPVIIITAALGCAILLVMVRFSLGNPHYFLNNQAPILTDYSNSQEFTQLTQLHLCSIPDKTYRSAGYRFTTISYTESASFTALSKNPMMPQALIDLHALSGVICGATFDAQKDAQKDAQQSVSWAIYRYPLIGPHTDTELDSTVDDILHHIPSAHTPRKITLTINPDQQISTEKHTINSATFSLSRIYDRACVAMLLPNFTLIVRDLYSPNCQNLEKLLSLAISHI